MKRTTISQTGPLESLEPRLLFDAGSLSTPVLDAPPAVTAPAVGVEREASESTDAFEVWQMSATGWQLVAGTSVSGPSEDVSAATPSGWSRYMARMHHGDGTWSVMECPASDTFVTQINSPPSLLLTGPTGEGSYTRGQNVNVTWDASDPDGDATTVYLWAFSWQTGWQAVSGASSGSAGACAWDTSAEWVQPGWYCFGAWVTDGQTWRATVGQDWVQIVEDTTPDGPVDPGSSEYSAILAGGVLTISGTDSDEDFTLNPSGGGIEVVYGTYSQTFTGVSQVVLTAYAGQDVIRVSYGVSANVTIYGGDGADWIYAAGAGSDVLYGGEGDDHLVSIGGGSDDVFGDAGLDTLWVDAADTLADATWDEYDGTSVHVVGEFYQPWSDDPNHADYVSLELDGSDLRDPTPTSSSYGYKDFSDQPLFVGSPSLSDVRQGYVGDCYFLASLASLTLQEPHLIEQMVTDLGDGTFAVRFYSGGSAEYLRVDGELPTWSSSSWSPVYAKLGRQGQLWVAVVEKAFTFYRYGENSYDSISGGWMSSVYQQVTGRYSSTVRVQGQSGDDVWSSLQSMLDAGRAVTVGSISSPLDPIVGGHAYTVESVREVGGVKYITVHNPWGVDGESWDSNYNDGLMELAASDFVQSFSYAVACRV